MVNLKLSVIVSASYDELSRDKVFACDGATPFFAEDYAAWAGIDAADIIPDHVALAQGIQARLPAGAWLVVSHK